jgi:hypothetical protein
MYGIIILLNSPSSHGGTFFSCPSFICLSPAFSATEQSLCISLKTVALRGNADESTSDGSQTLTASEDAFKIDAVVSALQLILLSLRTKAGRGMSIYTGKWVPILVLQASPGT